MSSISVPRIASFAPAGYTLRSEIFFGNVLAGKLHVFWVSSLSFQLSMQAPVIGGGKGGVGGKAGVAAGKGGKGAKVSHFTCLVTPFRSALSVVKVVRVVRLPQERPRRLLCRDLLAQACSFLLDVSTVWSSNV